MFSLPQILIIAAKFILPVIFLFQPLAIWANYFLDIIDGDLLMGLGLSDYTYQTIDKAADYFSYIFMLILGLRWRIKKPVLILFIYRTIGQLLFFITRNEQFFFIFQNFLEPLLLVYTFLIFKTKSEPNAYKLYQLHRTKIWLGIVIYKVINEWYLHLANIDLSSFFFGFNGGI